jgi:hypothetical protein
MKKIFNLLINAFNHIIKPLNLIMIKKSGYQELVRENSLLTELNEIQIDGIRDDSSVCIIFSMDRALQLHSLLSSYFEKVKNPSRVVVLYRTTSAEHARSYEEIFRLLNEAGFTQVAGVKQENKASFKSQLVSVMEKSGEDGVFFLVDDIVFIEDFDMQDVLKFDRYKFIPSLRMGANLNYCYTKGTSQPLPAFTDGLVSDRDKLCWKWNEAEFDWSYPISVDGHIFSRKEILACCRNTEFNSPNTFEGNLQVFKNIFGRRWGVCYKKSRLVNIPANKVQKENDNRFGGFHQDDLLKMWNDGYKMDYRRLYGFDNSDAHQEIDISFIKR